MQEKSRENYLRVTHVLSPFSGLQNIDSDVVANAGRRGSKVHKICEAIMLGLGEIGIDDEVAGYIRSFNQWWQDGKKIVAMEQRFWDDQYQFTGQVDMIIDTPEGLSVVDIKTSSQPSKTWPVQGSAYAYLARKAGYDIQKVFFLHLSRYGKQPKLYEYPIDINFFFSTYNVYNHFFLEA